MRPFVRAGMLLLAAACLPALAAAAPPRVVEASGDKSGISIQFDQPMLTWGGETTGALVGITPDAPCRW